MSNNETRLILADDDPDDYSFFQEALHELGVSVQLQYCENGATLMQLLSASQSRELPEILFLDLNMPRKSGFDCLKEIRSDKKFSGIDVVVISTSYEPEIVHLLYENGADRYIVKPCTFADLKKVINQVFRLKSLAGLKSNSKSDFVLQP